MNENGKELPKELPRLQAVFFAKFDPVQGPVVCSDAPWGSVKSALAHLSYQKQDGGGESDFTSETAESSDNYKLDFDVVSEFVIPKPELCHRLVTVCTDRCKILSYPQLLSSPKYPRNALIFNLCFVFQLKTDIKRYEPVVKKAGNFLRDLELESEFISRAEFVPALRDVVQQLFESLNREGGCYMVLDDANVLNLRLFNRYLEPPAVGPLDVPVLMRNVPQQMLSGWDLTIQSIIPYINGVYHVRKISELADVDIHLVAVALQHLIYYGLCELLDWFQASNLYTVSHSAISRIFSDAELSAACYDFVVSSHVRGGDPNTGPAHPSTADLFFLYTLFQPNRNVAQIVQEQPLLLLPTFLLLDERRYVDYHTFVAYSRECSRLKRQANPSVGLKLPLGVQITPSNSSFESMEARQVSTTAYMDDLGSLRVKSFAPAVDIQKLVAWGLLNRVLKRFELPAKNLPLTEKATTASFIV